KASGVEERAKIQAEIDTYVAQLRDSIGGASYAGSNLLQTTGATGKVSIISAYNRDSGGAVSTTTIDIEFTNIRLIDSGVTPPAAGTGILDTTGTASGRSILNINLNSLGGVTGADESEKSDHLLTDIESALGKMTNAAAELGAAKARIDMQKDFVSKLMDSIEKGVGQLVDADMNKESTRLQALQVQQQLGIQSLSIANTNSQNILALFK